MIETSEGMSNAIICRDGHGESFAMAFEADQKQFPVLTSMLGTLELHQRQAAVCHEVGMAPRDPAEYAPVETDIPTLIIEGAMDPITPPPMAEQILPGFSKATYVEFPYAGHGPSRSVECAGAMLNKFFDAPQGEPDLSCVEEMEKPEFWVPLYETSLVPRLGVLALTNKKKLIGPAAWLALSVVVLIIAFFVLTFAPIGRRLDKRAAVPSGGARLAAWLAAFFSIASLILLGTAIGATVEASKIALLVGLAPWARYGAIAGAAAGLAGIAAVVFTVRAQLHRRLPIGSLLGFVVTGLAALSFAVFLLVWDVRPF